MLHPVGRGVLPAASGAVGAESAGAWSTAAAWGAVGSESALHPRLLLVLNLVRLLHLLHLHPVLPLRPVEVSNCSASHP